MGPRPTQGDEKSLRPATTLYRTVALSFVIPSEAEGSAVPRTFRGHVFRQSAAERRDLCVDASSWKCFSTERTRISYFTALTSAAHVVLPKENHTHPTEATALDRKSGGAEGSAVLRTFRGNVF